MESRRVSNMKPFINKCNLKGINHSSKQEIERRLRRIIRHLLVIFCILKEKKYIQLISQKLIRFVKNKQNSINDSKRRKRKKYDIILQYENYLHY